MKHKGEMHRHPIRIAKPGDENYEEGKTRLHSTTHLVSKEHTGALAKYHHNRMLRVKDRSDTRAKHKANPIVSKVKPTAKGLEDAPNPSKFPSTMKHKAVQKLYTKTLQSHIDKHRAENPGLPKGKVQEGFGKVTMPAVYRHIKTSGWDSPNREPGLRGKPGMTEWHKACKTCAESKKLKETGE